MANELAEGFTDRKHSAQVIRREVRSRFDHGCGFAADLDDTNHFSLEQDGSTDDLLNSRSTQRLGLHTFEHRRVTH